MLENGCVFWNVRGDGARRWNQLDVCVCEGLSVWENAAVCLLLQSVSGCVGFY